MSNLNLLSARLLGTQRLEVRSRPTQGKQRALPLVFVVPGFCVAVDCLSADLAHIRKHAGGEAFRGFS
jgi:hypothetical protein